MFSLVLHSWRSWKHAWSVGLLAIGALAIGIGSTTAIYTVIHAVLLHPLPYANPDRYLTAIESWRGLSNSASAWSYPNMVDFQARNRTLEAFGCADTNNFNLLLNREPVRVGGSAVSPELVKAFNVPLLRGRWFTGKPADLYTVVISESLWRRGGSDPKIVGSRMTINSLPFSVAGVAPAWFRFPIDRSAIEIWIPMDPIKGAKTARDNLQMVCYAKMKAGVTLAQADADLKRVAAELEKQYPQTEKNHSASAVPLLAEAVRDIRPSLLLLLAASGALLLIACANVASLLLARSVARSRETAIRVALGGTFWQLALQYFSEGLLISLAGAAGGALVSVLLVRVVLSLASSNIPRADQVHLDAPVLFFALLVAVFSSVLFSLAPLWQALRISPNEVLSDGVRSSSSGRSRNLLSFFVTAEVALAFVLLALASLFLQHLGLLYRVNPGFDPEHVLTFSTYPSPGKYSTRELRSEYQSRLLRAVENLRGVESAGFSSMLPLTENRSDTYFVPDGRDGKNTKFSEFVRLYDFEFRLVSPDYFKSMGIPLVSGRLLTDSDATAPGHADDKSIVHQVLISSSGSSLLWPHGGAVGSFGTMGDEARVRVVGVVGDVLRSLDQPPIQHFYILYQNLWPTIYSMAWVVRSHLDNATLTREIRHAVASVDPEQALFDIYPMEQLVQSSLGREKLQSFMVTFFAGSALLLSMLGVYGVMAYSVRQRKAEIGTRMAIGATRGTLLRMVVFDGLKMSALGIVIGLLLVFLIIRIFSHEMLGFAVTGPAPFLVSILIVTALTFAACCVPAWRATLLSPMIAIRNEPETMWERTREGYQWLRSHVSTLIAQPEEARVTEASVLAEIVDSSRHADSFNEAIQNALGTLRTKIEAQSAVLLVKRETGDSYGCLAADPPSPDEWSLPSNALLLMRLRHYASALPITVGDLDSLHRWATENAPERLPEITTLQAMKPALAALVMSKEDITAILLIGAPEGRMLYTPLEGRLLRSVAAQFALMLENARLTDRIVEQERMRRELMLASEVQKRLFPENPPPTASLELAGFCLPARGVGGDYYDFLNVGDHHIGIALADVAGKGIAAALLMSIVQASLRSLVGDENTSLAQLAGKVNRLLHRSTGPSSYATFFYAEFDEDTLQLRYVNAGHNPPFLYRNGHEHSLIPFVASSAPIEELATGGMIIGMFSQSVYEEATVQLKSGDVLMAFTDGVSEAHDPNEEEFGEERLKGLLRKVAHLPINEMSSHVLADLKAWMRDAPQHDDLTFLLAKVQ